jgi:hypothetical protein
MIQHTQDEDPVVGSNRVRSVHGLIDEAAETISSQSYTNVCSLVMSYVWDFAVTLPAGAMIMHGVSICTGLHKIRPIYLTEHEAESRAVRTLDMRPTKGPNRQESTMNRARYGAGSVICTLIAGYQDR